MRSVKDIARLAGVSVATVSRALNNPALVAPETRKRVIVAARELRYQPNRVAQSLRTRRSKIVGLVVPDVVNPIYTELVKTIQGDLDDSGYSLILCESGEDPQKEINYLNLLHGWNAAGVIIAPVMTPDTSAPIWEAMSDRMVQISRYIPGLSTDVVTSDNEGGAWKVTSHLIKLGYRRIGLVGGPLNTNSGRDRAQGYLRALNEAGIIPSSDLVTEGAFSEDDGYKMTKRLMEREDPPEAIVSGSNLLTMGALLALKDLGKEIPRDVALAAFDDIKMGTVLASPLTVAVQRTAEIGKTAVKLLLRRIGGGKRKARCRIVVVPTDLVVRESCGCRLRPGNLLNHTDGPKLS